MEFQMNGRTKRARESAGDLRWLAVQTRDCAADGKFVYAVRSTGIYCRPSCPSRKPRPEQVAFFALPQAAEQKGFRPCRRCQPRLMRMRDARVETVARICRQIEAQVAGEGANGASDVSEEGRLTLGALSRSGGLSPHQLERAFLGTMGMHHGHHAAPIRGQSKDAAAETEPEKRR
jgi:AraC family transcriptional regulator of adaptative response/methylated-DNA-[protein]-cysteine methyltransferase